jgi:hypothetical protein
MKLFAGSFVLLLSFAATTARGQIGGEVALAPWGVATPLSGGMNAPGTISINENLDFDEVMYVDDTDEFMKFENGQQTFVNLGNPDGEITFLPAQQGELTSGDFLGRVLSSQQGGKKNFHLPPQSKVR